MTKRNQIYKCPICGNIVEVTHEGAGTLVCCGQPMELMEEIHEDTGVEKHLPVIEVKDNQIIVTVGDVLHPMEDAHYIEWIELDIDGHICKKYLNPGDKPQASFDILEDYTNITARTYCNIHGLWSTKI
jgi:superoxide reductase